MRVWLAMVVGLAALGSEAGARQEALPNAFCPVMTEEPADPSHVIEHEGKRVYFCCRRCRVKFEADPGAYLANLPQFGAGAGVGAQGAGDPAGESPTVQPNLEDPVPAARPATPVDRPPGPSPQGPLLRDKALDLAGRLHTAVVHFPIGLLLAAAALELIALIGRSSNARVAAAWCLALGALGAVAAATCGWVRAGYLNYQGPAADTLEVHRWLGVASAGIAVVVTIVVLASRREAGGPRALAVIVAAGMVSVGAYFGAELVHGRNHLFDGLGEQAAPAEARPPAAAPGPGAQRDGAPSDFADALAFADDNLQAFLARRALRLAGVAAPAVDAREGHEIDDLIRASWRRAGLPQADGPPPVCDDATFMRRVYLDMIGVIPTIEEGERFLASADPEKRVRLIDELLARDEDYAAHWTPFWEDALGSVSTRLQGGIPTRGDYRGFIERNFRENTPFDVLAARLIDPTMPGHQPVAKAVANGKESRVGYIRNETHVDTLQSAANVAQVFLGTAMKCAGCHSHFENPEWPQTRFLGFAGMFGGRDLELIRCEQRTGDVIAAAFPFEIPGAPADVPATEEGRLRRVAQLLTDPHNPRFARAIVNRLWKRYLGLGLFEPVDDFREDVPASHPALLDWLAHDFMTHGYDLKHTIRLILNSRTYQTAYDPALADTFDVQDPGAPRHFRSPSLRRLTAEQLIDSVRVASSQRLERRSRLYLDTTSTSLTRSLGKPASRNEISTGRPDDIAVVSALELLNGAEYHGLVYGGRLVGEPGPDARAAVERLYRATLSRPPAEAERELAEEYVRSALERAGPAPRAPREQLVWIDDELPAGAAVTVSTGGPWPWTEERASSGRRSHAQASGGRQVQHFVVDAQQAMAVGPRDVLFVEAFLDPDDPPKQIMVQWNDGSWEHRASWGEDRIMYGVPGTASRRPMGALPPTGRWVHLRVPAADVGLSGRVTGMSFDQFGGSVWWDKAGVVRVPEDPASAPVGDLFWALVTGPEFQYIR